jgi:hypothetical protein
VITVLVPVLGRPHKARVISDSIHNATSVDHVVHFLCSYGDTDQIEACEETGDTYSVMRWKAGPADFAKKINWGAKKAKTEYVQVGADDLVFHPGWDVAAVGAADDSGKGVIGTNDLYNARVKRRLSSTHPFVRKAYLDTWGGTFDNTGYLFSEAYDHQYVDDEFAQTAQVRHEWVFAANAVVEHLHPYFKRAEMDSTYEKALRATTADFQLFSQRVRQMRRAVPRERVRMRQQLTKEN